MTGYVYTSDEVVKSILGFTLAEEGIVTENTDEGCFDYQGESVKGDILFVICGNTYTKFICN